MDFKFQELPDPAMRGQGPVTEWYQGRSIFITGASGFMGKVLVEKLLYQCTGLKCIYILMRPKRGRTAEQRIEDMWKLPAFHRLRKLDPDSIKKIVPLHGELLDEGLGLNDRDRDLIIENVSVVFHCAATLRLEAKLKDAVEMNTEGTEKVLELAKQMKNLKAFVHLSTAFCTADIDVLEEKVYRTADDPKEIIKIVKWVKDDALVQATPAIIAPHPNTYTYSKRLAETLVADEYDNIPAVIARPSIVCPAGIEPLPGWVDSLNGPMGITVGAGKGVIRSLHAKREHRAQVVPADVAISALIVIAWKMGSATAKPPEIPVYNMTNDGVVRMTWGEILDCGRSVCHKYPFEMQIWYPDGDIRPNWYIHKIYCFFFHWIPAYLIDFLMLIFLQKRFMVRLMRRIDDGLELLQFFTTREWIFKSEQFLGLNNYLTSLERRIFRIEFESIPKEEYLTECYLGARLYIMKEDFSSIPRCKRIQSVLYVVDRAFTLAFYLGLIWLLCQCSDTVNGAVEVAASYLRQVPLVRAFIPMPTKF